VIIFDQRTMDFMVRGRKGMLVVGRLPAGGAILAEAGVVCGDIVLAVNGRPIRSWAEFLAARDSREDAMVLTLFRDGAQQVLVVPLPPRRSSAPPPLSRPVLRLVIDDDDEPFEVYEAIEVGPYSQAS